MSPSPVLPPPPANLPLCSPSNPWPLLSPIVRAYIPLSVRILLLVGMFSGLTTWHETANWYAHPRGGLSLPSQLPSVIYSNLDSGCSLGGSSPIANNRGVGEGVRPTATRKFNAHFLKFKIQKILY